ncbi:O-phosphoseryl-tRNA selenium transferase [Cyclospora cayetanensis]|uniref:O-phosphoseryl-tRNA(Sec) selenium transferase n=1 Tax=Cyclospora cayetanensis TaxID=88456 RepID=A0A1D3CWW3_9EIME|nr:O-phosphoseryl-tRNA selenium transferase [Cyclospora cayetanensis]
MSLCVVGNALYSGMCKVFSIRYEGISVAIVPQEGWELLFGTPSSTAAATAERLDKDFPESRFFQVNDTETKRKPHFTMEKASFDAVEDLLSPSYCRVAREGRRTASRMPLQLLRTSLPLCGVAAAPWACSLLSQRQLPEAGWTSLQIEHLLLELAATDANNQPDQASVGEREGRIFSSLVRQRHYHFAHGIGRQAPAHKGSERDSASGDIFALQPKAVGSSLLYQLTSYLALHAVRLCGVQSAARCLPVPIATGMSMSLCLGALKSLCPEAEVVILSRIDQKACIKAVTHAGLKLRVVDQRLEPDGTLTTDLAGIESAMTAEAHRLLCVISTTSAFAPRQPDMILQIAQLCKKMGVFHLVNNAYGLQCSKCCALVEQGCSAGRVDLVVSSCDKNFLTPVGGALIYGPAPELVSRVSACYPGRASISPILDLLITLLEMGKVGLKQLLRDRKELFAWFKEELTTLCASLGLRVLPSPRNKISIAVDLSTLKSEAYEDRGPSFLGSQLFFRRCSGLRVVTPSAAATQLAGISLQSFGSHCRFPVPYCAMACAIGAKKEELQLFLQRFGRLIGQARNTSLPVAPPHQAETEEPRSGDRHPSAKEEERQYSEGETS